MSMRVGNFKVSDAVRIAALALETNEHARDTLLNDNSPARISHRRGRSGQQHVSLVGHLHKQEQQRQEHRHIHNSSIAIDECDDENDSDDEIFGGLGKVSHGQHDSTNGRVDGHGDNHDEHGADDMFLSHWMVTPHPLNAWLVPPPHRGETWMELFYDLVFVAVCIQIGIIVKDHGLTSADNFRGIAVIGAVFFLSWLHVVLYQNRFHQHDCVHMLCYFLLTVIVLMGAIALEKEHDRWLANMLAITVIASRTLVAALYALNAMYTPLHLSAMTSALAQLLSATMFGVSLVVTSEMTQYRMWQAALCIEVVGVALDVYWTTRAGQVALKYAQKLASATSLSSLASSSSSSSGGGHDASQGNERRVSDRRSSSTPHISALATAPVSPLSSSQHTDQYTRTMLTMTVPFHTHHLESRMRGLMMIAFGEAVIQLVMPPFGHEVSEGLVFTSLAITVVFLQALLYYDIHARAHVMDSHTRPLAQCLWLLANAVAIGSVLMFGIAIKLVYGYMMKRKNDCSPSLPVPITGVPEKYKRLLSFSCGVALLCFAMLRAVHKPLHRWTNPRSMSVYAFRVCIAAVNFVVPYADTHDGSKGLPEVSVALVTCLVLVVPNLLARVSARKRRGLARATTAAGASASHAVSTHSRSSKLENKQSSLLAHDHLGDVHAASVCV